MVRCKYDCPEAPTFCSDGGIGSLPIGHYPGSGEPIFACSYGDQCQDEMCAPRAALENDELCFDSCLNAISNGVRWTGAARNGICKFCGSNPKVLLVC